MRLRHQCTALILVTVLFGSFSIQAQTSTTQTNTNNTAKKKVQPGPATKKTEGGNGTVHDSAINSPRDVATGQASGKRQHKPVNITKQTDAASPVLMNSKPAASPTPTPKPTSVRKTNTGPSK